MQTQPLIPASALLAGLASMSETPALAEQIRRQLPTSPDRVVVDASPEQIRRAFRHLRDTGRATYAPLPGLPDWHEPTGPRRFPGLPLAKED